MLDQGNDKTVQTDTDQSMNIAYILPRFVRHIFPDAWIKFILEQRFIIKPGIETTNPDAAVQNYLNQLEKHQFSVTDKKILVFGYGGRFDVGCGLLANGARQVILLDLFTYPDSQRNRALLEQYPNLLEEKNGIVLPSGEKLVLIEGNILDKKVQTAVGKVDLVLSNSVYEHIDQVENITQALASLLTLLGAHYHNIDLRDHFFKYPFEMLTFKEKIWVRWLNPSSNHNRYRYNDYRNAFEAYFNHVQMTITESLPEEFQKVKSKIQPEFIVGDDNIDAVAQISVFACDVKS